MQDIIFFILAPTTPLQNQTVAPLIKMLRFTLLIQLYIIRDTGRWTGKKPTVKFKKKCNIIFTHVHVHCHVLPVV